MKRLICLSTAFIIICFYFITTVNAQGVGINPSGNAPDASAGLDVDFSNKGLLMPRLTNTERDAISNPAPGLVIFNTTTGCINYRLSNGWYQLCGSCTAINTVGVQPAGQSVCETGTAVFTVGILSGGLTFQWQVSTDNGSTWNNISNSSLYSGVTTQSLSVINPTLSMSGYQYRVILTACSAGNPSNGATLTVTSPAAASAGSDRFSGCSSAVLSGNIPPSGGTGQWTVSSGQVSGFSFNNSSSPTSPFTGTSGETYTLRWTITTACGSSYDEMLLTFGLPSAFQSGLMGYYPFCSNANDLTGNGYHGSVNGASLTSDRFGVPNSAYLFNGSSNYISMSNSAYRTMQAHTVAMFVKRTGSGNNWPRLFLNGDVNTSLVITQNNTDQNFLYRLIGCGDMFTSTASMDNTWKFFVFTFDGSVRKVYMNGVLADQLSGSCTLPTASGSQAYIGGDTSSSLDGSIDEVMIWNHALSASEVSQLYNLLGH